MASSPNKYGIPPACPNANCTSVAPPAPRCRSCGRTQNTSSCSVLCGTGASFDLPPQTVRRYLVEKTVSPRLAWRFNHKIRSLPVGMDLRIETLAPADIRFSIDDWQTVQNVSTRDVGLGIHIADLTARALPAGKSVRFTFYWLEAQRWEGTDFSVRVATS